MSLTFIFNRASEDKKQHSKTHTAVYISRDTRLVVRFQGDDFSI